MSTRQRRRKVRALIAMGGMLTLVFGVLTAASADTGALSPDRTAWYWQSAERVPVQYPTLPAPVGGCSLPICPRYDVVLPPNPSNPEHIVVAQVDGKPDKRAYIGFNLDDPKFMNATFKKFLVTLQVSSASHAASHPAVGSASQIPLPIGLIVPVPEAPAPDPSRNRVPQTFNDGAAKLVACAVDESSFLSDDVEGAPTNVKVLNQDGTETQVRSEPSWDCSKGGLLPLTRAADGSSWSVDIASIANLWASGEFLNNGIVVRPADGVPQQLNVAEAQNRTWSVEFHTPDAHEGIRGIYADVEFTPGAPSDDLLLPFLDDTGAPTAVLGDAEVFGIGPTSDVGTGAGAGVTTPRTPGLRRPLVAGSAGPGHIPGVVWLLIPLFVLATWAVREALVPDWAAREVGSNRIAQRLRDRRFGVPAAVDE